MKQTNCRGEFAPGLALVSPPDTFEIQVMT